MNSDLMARRLHLAVWMNVPSHHQSSFFEAIRELGVALSVRYYGRVSEARKALGWADTPRLPEGEAYLDARRPPLTQLSGWENAVHIVPGCGSWFLRGLARSLSDVGAEWIHWSERSSPGLRRLLGYPLKRWYASLVNRYALGALGIGLEALRDFRRWGIREEKMANLPYAVAPVDRQMPADAACERFRGDRRAFLFLGSLYHGKGVDVAIEAFVSIARRDPGWVLLLVGDDRTHGAYQRRARKLGVSDRVLFRGPLPSSRVAAALQCADVLLLPSRYDGWGVVLNEAASAGKALIASDGVGGAYHLVEPATNGYRVKAGSVASLRAAMAAYVACPTLAEEHGRRSLERFADYTPAHNAQRLLEIIHAWRAMQGTAIATDHPASRRIA